MVSNSLIEDWNLPLVKDDASIIFPHTNESTTQITQELQITLSLDDSNGNKIEKTVALQFHVVKNIPYGFLIGVRTMFSLQLGLKYTKEGYKPYFDNEILPSFSSSLYMEDSQGTNHSFIYMPEESEIDLNLLPECYHKYAAVFNQKIADKLPPHRNGLDCAIELLPGAQLHRGPVYPMNPDQEKEANNYIDENLRKGFIRNSKSPAAYPVLFQKKKDGSPRFCVDYRNLNKVTKRDSYPLPLYNHFFEQVAGSTIFSKLDLKSAYNLIRIREGDEEKTAFRTKRGQFEYLVMPFGLTNAPSIFQRFINYVLSDFIDKFVVVYLDDILIYSKSIDNHIQHVSAVLGKLLENHLVAKLEKCLFHVPEIEFLGHVISGSEIKMDPKKIEAVRNWPTPTSVKELQSFLGLCNYYRRFIKNFSLIASPLYQLTKKDKKFIWLDEHNNAFNQLKILITSAPVLVPPDPGKKFILETDASHFALGCVLSQSDDLGLIHPVYFYSRSFTKAERNYSITDKELLAIISGLEEWKYLLIGTKEPIEIYTDHRNLLFATKPQKISLRQAHWQEILSYYNYRVIYRPGNVNVRADALSRRPDLVPSSNDDLECILDPNRCSFICCLNISELNPLLDSIRNQQYNDPLYKNIIKYLNGNADAGKEVKSFDLSKFSLKNNILLFNNLICVPKPLRYDVLSSHHDYSSAGHLGVAKTCELISRNFYWPNWRDDVKSFIKSCKICSEMKASRHKPYGNLIPPPIPECPWMVVEIDFITNIPSFNNKREYSIMVCCDRLTKMVHLGVIEGTPSSTEVAILFLKTVFYLHGLPHEIITDCGSQFTSSLWYEIVRILSIKHTMATTNHHTTVGQVERLNQSIEQFIRCFIRSFPNEDWLDWLYLAEFIYNNSKNSSTGQSPFLAFNGFLPLFHPSSASLSSLSSKIYHIPDFQSNIDKIKHILAASQELYSEYSNRHRESAPTFKVDDLVWLRRPSNFIPKAPLKLCPRKYGPFRITEVLEYNNYRLDLSNSPFSKKFDIFNVCELEPFSPRPSDINGSSRIGSILDCRINALSGNCEYLVSYIDNSLPNSWVDSSIVDNDSSLSSLLASFNSISQNQLV